VLGVQGARLARQEFVEREILRRKAIGVRRGKVPPLVSANAKPAALHERDQVVPVLARGVRSARVVRVRLRPERVIRGRHLHGLARGVAEHAIHGEPGPVSGLRAGLKDVDAARLCRRGVI